MNKKLLITIFTCLVFGSSFASTNITTASVSGTWDIAGSPYLIFNNIRVDSATTLVIEPGVSVIFQGAYGIDVAGTLCAKGTAVKPIYFHAQDTTGWSIDTVETGGWRGVHFLSYNSPIADSSSFEYCHVYDMKAIFYAATLAHFCSFRDIAIRNCKFYHDKSLGTGGVVMISNDPPFYLGPIITLKAEISGCEFYNDIAMKDGWDSTYTPRQQLPGALAYVQGCHWANIFNNNFHNNISSRVLYVIQDSALVANNTIEQNDQIDTVNDCSPIDFVFSYGLFDKNIVHQNSAYLDAMISSYYSSVDVNGNFICNNRCGYMWSGGFCPVADGGAAIRFFNETYNDSVVYHNFVRNNVIANNNTGTYGAAIYDYGVNVKIVNNDIVNNFSGWGNSIYLEYLSGQSPKLMIKNNIIYGNYGNFYLNNEGAMEINHNWFDVSLSGELPYAYIYARLNSDTFNVVGDTAGLVAPTLTSDYTENALTANFYLLPSSACIHAGDTTNAYPDSTDIAGNSRLTGGAIDIGAYQYHGVLEAANVGAKTTILLYPNPATSNVFVQTPEAVGNILIEDITGKIIGRTPVVTKSTAVDLQRIPAGSYFAIWQKGGIARSVEKFVVE